MGCIARLGCLAVLCIAAILGWFTRDRWLTVVHGTINSSGSSTTTETVNGVAERTWEPITLDAAARGKRAIDGLNSSSGPVFANLHANEIASYVFQAVGHVPTPSDSAEAAVIGDVLYVRAIVPLRDIASSGVLGPLGGLLGDREKLSMGGSFRVLRPGMSEFQVREIKLRDFTVPHGAIPKLVSAISKGVRPQGMADDALPVPTPMNLGDVRIGHNRVTLYKTVAGPQQ